MRRLILVFMCFCFILISGCSSVEEKVYTSDKKNDIISEIGKSNMSKEDKELFAKAIDDKTGKYEGKTVKEIVNDQKRIIEERKKLEEEMKNALIVSFGNKGQVHKDINQWIFSNYATFDMIITNNTKKDIQAFKGITIIDDIFGDNILRSGYRNDELIKAGETKTIPLSYECNEFISKDMKFFETDLDKLKMYWETKAIVFSDGTKIGDVK